MRDDTVMLVKNFPVRDLNFQSIIKKKKSIVKIAFNKNEIVIKLKISHHTFQSVKFSTIFKEKFLLMSHYTFQSVETSTIFKEKFNIISCKIQKEVYILGT